MSPIIKVDLTEAQSRKPLPIDDYAFEILEVEGPKEGANSHYITIILSVIDGEFEGRKVYHNLPISGKGAGIFADFYARVTGEEIDVDNEESLEFDPDDLLGKQFEGTITHEEYPEGSGEMQHRLNKVLQAI
jgi:hypothetical protein